MRKLALVFLALFVFPAFLAAQYPNVVIGTQNLPNEPTICISPKDPAVMAAGANIDNYYFSTDGGHTWSSGVLTSSLGVWGDPVIVADTAGHFYFFHLSVPTWNQWLDRIVCQKSQDGGQTWSDGNWMGLNGSKDQDKEWAAVDPVSNTIHVCWTEFDKYGSAEPGDSTRILYSRSIDAGASWSEAVRINNRGGDCLDQDNTVEGAVPAVGPGGEVYVAWAGPDGLLFTKSADGGLTWPSANKLIGAIPGGWDYGVPGINRANGLPVTCCDLGNGPFRGSIYVNWTDQRNGEDDTDVWFTRSTDGGETWTSPLRVNDDPPGRHQFFSWMTVDPSDGTIYLVFYDRRNHTGNLTDVFMAVSHDGGSTFTNFRVSESPFDPDQAVFFGDYTHIAAQNGVVRPVWTRLENGQLSIVTALVDSIYTGIRPEKVTSPPFSLEQNFPNPVQEQTHIAYRMHQAGRVSLRVCDAWGDPVAILVKGTERTPGKHVEHFNPRQYGLEPGFYFYELVAGDAVLRRKMIVR